MRLSLDLLFKERLPLITKKHFKAFWKGTFFLFIKLINFIKRLFIDL